MLQQRGQWPGWRGVREDATEKGQATEEQFTKEPEIREPTEENSTKEAATGIKESNEENTAKVSATDERLSESISGLEKLNYVEMKCAEREEFGQQSLEELPATKVERHTLSHG